MSRPRRRGPAPSRWWPAAILLLASPPALRAEGFPTLNDFGGSGLLQTPNARIADEGEFAAGYSRVSPYNQIQVFVAPLPWLETTLRYTDVSNVAYSPDPAFSGTQSYKDRSFGVKLRLLKENDYLPDVSVGIQDFGGTGVFGGEYLVFSRRYYDLDFSVGMGWGRNGAGGSIRNPLGILANHFDKDRTTTDPNDTTPGGGGFGRLFTGRTVGIFGGVEWRTPLRGLKLQAEYDANDYQHEGLGNKFDQAFPVNVGADYEAFDGVNLGVGYERGNTLMLRINLHTNFQKGSGPRKTADPPPPPIAVRSNPPPLTPLTENTSPVTAPAPLPEVRVVGLDPPPQAGTVAASDPVSQAFAESVTVDATRQALAKQTITLVAMDFVPERRELKLWVRQNRWRSPPKVVGRVSRVLTSTAPAAYEIFTVIGTENGAETWRYSTLRKDFERLDSDFLSTEELGHDTLVTPPRGGPPQAAFTGLAPLPKFSWDMAPAIRQQVGGPDGFYFGQIYWKVSAGLQITEHWSAASILGFNIANNFGDIRQTSNSQLPHVRSDIVKYLQEGENGLVRLETNYIWSPASQWYTRLSGGIFEEMYGGVAAETLYRPFRQRWALGLDANYVKQRDFNEQFDFRNYYVATGHLNFYYDFPWYDLKTKVSVGRYLAKDYGTTIDVAREFKSGVSVGAFVTFTNVSSAKFGEGSYDKGVYVTVPFDIFFRRSTRREGTFLFRPLTRDGGQKVRDGIDLYSATTGAYDNGSVREWPDVAR